MAKAICFAQPGDLSNLPATDVFSISSVCSDLER